MAIVAGLAVALLLRETHRFRVCAPLLVAVVASHGILDALTDGGRGVALR